MRQPGQRPVLSVAVPAYDVETTLDACISSLILPEGEREEVEILIVDDGSEDATPVLASRWEERYPRCVRVIRKQNGGHGSAVNAGIRAAAGRYFRVVDGDDRVYPREFRSFVRKLQGLDCDAVVTRFAIARRGRRGKVVRSSYPLRLEYGRSYPFRRICGHAGRHAYFRMHELTIRTALLREHSIRIREHSFYVDMEYSLYPVPWLRTICMLPECVYRYQTGGAGQSVSPESMRRNAAQHEAVLNDLLTFYRAEEQKGTPKEILRYLAGAIARMHANQIRIELGRPTGARSRSRLRALEHRIRREYPQVYRRMPKVSVWLLRLSGYTLYPAACLLLRLRERTYRKDV